MPQPQIRAKKKPFQQLSFELYIKKIMKNSLPATRISRRSVIVMDNFVVDMLDHILRLLKTINRHSRRKTLSVATLENVIKLYLPPSLYPRVETYGRSVVHQVSGNLSVL